MSTAVRVERLSRLFAAANLASIAVIPRAWTASREVPVQPLLPFLEGAPDAAHRFPALLAGLACLALLLRPLDRRPLPVLAACYLALFALDVLRAQQVFLFFLLWVPVLWTALPRPARAEPELDTLRASVAGLYLWAGLQKLNHVYVHFVFLWVLRRLLPGAPDGAFTRAAAVGSALLEAGAGLMLLFPRARLAGVAVLVSLHVVLLAYLATLEPVWGYAIWPFKLFALAPLLFLGCASSARDVLLPRSASGALVRALALALPALNLAGLWPDVLSFHFYSGRTPKPALVVGPEFVAGSPFLAQARDGATGRLSWIAWSAHDTGLELYPSPWYHRAVFAKLCASRRPPPLGLVLRGRPETWTGRQSELALACPEAR